MTEPVHEAAAPLADPNSLLAQLLQDQACRASTASREDSLRVLTEKALRCSQPGVPLPVTLSTLSSDCLSVPTIWPLLIVADPAATGAIQSWILGHFAGSPPHLLEQVASCLLSISLMIGLKKKAEAITAYDLWEVLTPTLSLCTNMMVFLQAKKLSQRLSRDAEKALMSSCRSMKNIAAVSMEAAKLASRSSRTPAKESLSRRRGRHSDDSD